MASFQIVKSFLSPFSVSKSYLYPKFSSHTSSRKRGFSFRSKKFSSAISISRRPRVSCKLQENENQSNGEEPPESLFMKELKRRGMTPTSLLEESNKGSNVLDEETKYRYREEDGGFSGRNALYTNPETGRNLFNQREQSMALNSEGLEGLIPRAKLLLTLGGTFFLGFGPFILITVAFFSALYLDLKTEKKIGEGRESGGLYLFDVGSPPPTACVTTSALHIHSRLGHPSLEKLSTLDPVLSMTQVKVPLQYHST